MKSRLCLAVLLLAALPVFSGTKTAVQPPANEPARVTIEGSSISLFYQGRVIFSGKVLNPECLRNVTSRSVTDGGRVNQVVALFSKEGQPPVALSGTVEGSEESFACESEPRPAGLLVVRHSSGISRSKLNNAVYDRRWDALLSVDDPWRTRVELLPQQADGLSRLFSFRAEGSEIILRFRPRFYQRHRGLTYFEPWTYSVWPSSVAGWCSWFAFFENVTEADILRTADAMSEVLAPFGFEYLQIDDGYERELGPPSAWLIPNDKFPGGLSNLARSIQSMGLKPGIWTSVAIADVPFVEAHKSWFVLDRKGRPARGNWVSFSLDGSNEAALNGLIRPLYKGLADMGWQYFKLDTLRHLRYEGYNSNLEYFAAKKVDPVAAYRNVVSAVRREIGRRNFLLGCWGIRPELVGLIDGCRIGTDGFSFAGLAQYNSFNNVVWRNDPDHIELSDREAYRSTAVTTLTGSLMMLTDKPERYRTRYVEPAKRSAPVLFTLPGQVYDVDPSRSQRLGGVDAEVSGKEPKPFDAGLAPVCNLYALEINRPFEHWLVLGRTGGDLDQLRLADLGLDPNKEYYVFDFWEKKLLGSFSGSFPAGRIDPSFNCQVLILRERLARPQVLATNRHITGGGVDLLDVAWKDNRLAGRSRLVAGDPYEITVTVPEGFVLKSFSSKDARASTPDVRGRVAKLTCSVEKSGEAEWEILFETR
jgi:alpha-galactosidase